jgi:tetratricopeptide (TPR) repeat protein
MVRALLIAAVMAAGVACATQPPATRPPLDPLPDLAGRSPALASHIRNAYEAAARVPSSAAAVSSLCVAYHADMLFAEASRCYERLATLDSDWRWDYYRALIDIELGGGDALAARLRALASRVPDSVVIWLRLADAEFKASRYEAAADAWRRARALPPVDSAGTPPHVTEVPHAAYAALGLARVALAADDAEGARALLEPVTQDAPSFGPAFRLLGEAYRRLGRRADADRAIARAARRQAFAPFIDPLSDALTRQSRNSTLLLRAASEASLSVNGAWSEYLARRAVEFEPRNPEAIAKLARVLRTLGRNEEALPLFRQYRELVPGDFLGLANEAGCLSALGRFDEAEPLFRQALAGLDDPVTHYNLGLLLATTGRLDDAAREYRLALDRDAAYLDARGNLAAVLVRQGRFDAAVRELRRLVEIDAESAVGFTNLGLVLLEQGKRADARAALRRALEIDPTMARAAEVLRSIGGS